MGIPVNNRDLAALNYITYGQDDPTVVPTPGFPGLFYIRVPSNNNPSGVGVYQKITNTGTNTAWQLVGGGGGGGGPATGITYTPANPLDWQAVPTNVQQALDTLGIEVNYRNSLEVFVDITNGSDVTGNGSFLRPYQTMTAAIAAVNAAPAGDYVLVLAPGVYAEAPIAWPVALGKNVSIHGMSAANTVIDTLITYTSLGLGDENIVFQDVNVSNQLVFDLALGNVVNIILSDGRYSVSRIDTLPPGPQGIYIYTSFVDNYDLASLCYMLNCRFVGGGSNILQATGFLVMQGGIFASVAAQIDGTLFMNGVLAQGTTLTGSGSVNSDASSLFNLIVTGPTVSLLDAADKVSYAPATPANWLVSPNAVNAALDELASRISGLNISFDNTRYVSLNGNDLTGNGSLNKPYLTVKAAMNSILDATNLKRYAIMVMPGRYTETNLTLKANVFVIGVGQNWFATRIANNVAISLDADFNVANDCRSGFANINIGSALNMDFNAVSSNEGKVYFNNCQITSSLTLTKFSAINQCTIADCQTFGAIVQNGCNVEYQNNDFFGSVTVNSATGVTTTATFHDNAFESNLSLLGNGVNPLNARLSASSVAGVLTANNALVTVSSDVVSLTSAPVITGGAVLTLRSQAQNLGYVPAVPANWSVVPTQVKEALDTLAATSGSESTEVEFRTVSAPEAAAKQLTLAATPSDSTKVVAIFGGLGQFYADDYTVAGDVVDWNGLGMDAIGVVAGNKIIFIYNT